MNGQSVILIVIFMVMIMRSRGQVSRVLLHLPPFYHINPLSLS